MEGAVWVCGGVKEGDEVTGLGFIRDEGGGTRGGMRAGTVRGRRRGQPCGFGATRRGVGRHDGSIGAAVSH